MDVTLCPHCAQRIVNARSNADGQLRCPSCQKPFELARPAPNAISDGTENIAQPATVLTSDKTPVRPLGPEPTPASYTLLRLFGWTVLLGSAFQSALNLYRMVLFLRGSTGGIARTADLLPYIHYGLRMLSWCFIGILLFSITKSCARLDRSATWITWRSGALREAISLPPGHSLPYILPLTGTGALLIIVAIATSGEARLILEFAGIPPHPLNMFLVEFTICGVLLFSAGLACGDLRRFFWRMRELARRLPEGERSSDLQLTRDIYPNRAVPGSAPAWLLPVALLFALCVVSVSVLFLTGVHRDANIGTVAALANAASVYSLYRLARLWTDMQQSWLRAGRAFGGFTEPFYGLRRTVGLVLLARVIALAIPALLVLFAVILAILKIPRWHEIFLQLVASTILWIGLAITLTQWLAATKRDTFEFVKATAKFGSAPARATLTSLCGGLLVLTALLSLLTAALQFSDITGFAGNTKRGWVIMVLFGMIWVAVSAFPKIWLATLAADFERAAANLEACREHAGPVTVAASAEG